MNRVFLGVILFGSLFLAPRLTLAIPPPDVIANIGSQFAQIFSLVIVLFSAAAGAAFQYFGRALQRLKSKHLWFVLAAIGVLAVSLLTAYLIIDRQTAAEQKAYEDEVEAAIELGIRENDALDAPEEATPDFIRDPDPNIRFIARYYQYLGTGEIDYAYSVSTKAVSYDTYASWYELVTKTEVESITKITDREYSVLVKLYEGTAVTTYGVIMTLGSGVILNSEVRIIEADEGGSFTDEAETENAFHEANKDLPLSVSNEEFEQLRQGDIFVLDAREDEEYELGHYVGSEHIRFADVLAGAWVNLPTDQVVYVLCWSGIRGGEVAEFLRSKGVVAQYLEDGASGWVADGGAWEGEILFTSKYSDERYTGTFTTEEVHDLVGDGTVLVDARQKTVYARSHIPGSINISIFFTPSIELDALFDQVPPASRVITVCDDYVSCFDAKIAGVKLEKLGHTFLGRYTSPSDY